MVLRDSVALVGAVADGFDDCRVGIPPSLARLMRHPVDFGVAERARAELTGLLERYVHRKPGVVVLTGVPTAITVPALMCVTGLLGRPRPHNRDGDLIAEIGRPECGHRLATDAADGPRPTPDYVALLCVRPSKSGCVLVHLDDIVAESAPGLIGALRRPFHFDRNGDQRLGELSTVRKPILFTQNGRPAIAYRRDLIEAGHRRHRIPPLTDAQVSALDGLDSVLSRPSIRVGGRLRAGELAIFDNLALLRGWTEFRGDSRQLLLRTWIHADPEPANRYAPR
ncbi:TauD/TfdA family dioxygenase [Nocardia arthritidis]|uniref:TauD/TfdA-like domain-containing protein n=1 Tax=Nocardia arthritidis TaxID=228602 RepID=A0A6G9YHZ1_9NOCA|nr:TauD/TfdA family dioxygenase [Nocardia arthritidis]QIS12811.1 hypothetical protein F5544_24780 [Nocardia arthritidis]